MTYIFQFGGRICFTMSDHCFFSLYRFAFKAKDTVFQPKKCSSDVNSKEKLDFSAELISFWCFHHFSFVSIDEHVLVISPRGEKLSNFGMYFEIYWILNFKGQEGRGGSDQSAIGVTKWINIQIHSVLISHSYTWRMEFEKFGRKMPQICGVLKVGFLFIKSQICFSSYTRLPWKLKVLQTVLR